MAAAGPARSLLQVAGVAALRAQHALLVKLSNRYCYAEVVRRSDGKVVASASTLEKEIGDELRSVQASLSDTNAAKRVGAAVAARAKQVDVAAVTFSKPRGRPFHGKLAALVGAVAGGGLRFK